MSLPPGLERIRRFLRGMTAHTVDVRVGREAARPVLGDRGIVLPAALPDAARIAAAAHALAHWRYSPANVSADALKPIGLTVAGLIEDARAEALLATELPGLRALWAPSYATIDREGLTFPRLCARLAKALFDPAYRDGNPWVEKGVDGFRRRSAALDDYRAFRELASILANDLGQMRVRFEPDDGNWLHYRDDNAWLWTRSADTTEPAAPNWIDALTGEAAQGGRANEEPPPDPHAPRYPEWNCRTSRERHRWTTLLERPAPAADAPPALVAALTADRQTAPAAPAVQRRMPTRVAGRHPDGDVLDLDAAIALRIAQHRRCAPDLKVFRRRTSRDAPAPVLILLDLSASTADGIASLEKRAAFLIGEMLERQRRRWAVHGFTSNGRHRVYYTRFKDFAEPFDTPRRHALLGAGSGLSTRTGAALRHAAALAYREAAETRANVVLISDGEAADIDVFDPRYLAEDARHAARDVGRRGIALHGLSFGAPPGLSTILGSGPHCRHVLDHEHLPTIIARMVARLAG